MVRFIFHFETSHWHRFVLLFFVGCSGYLRLTWQYYLLFYCVITRFFLVFFQRRLQKVGVVCSHALRTVAPSFYGCPPLPLGRSLIESDGSSSFWAVSFYFYFLSERSRKRRTNWYFVLLFVVYWVDCLFSSSYVSFILYFTILCENPRTISVTWASSLQGSETGDGNLEGRRIVVVHIVQPMPFC